LKSIMNDVSKGKRVDESLNAAMKRVLIADLGKDWLVPFVSLVDEPCVPKAKFFAIKKKTELQGEKQDESVWDKIIKRFKKDDLDQITENTIKLTREATKAGRSISDDTFAKLKSALEALQKLIDKADKERKPDYLKDKKMKGDELEMEEKDVIKLVDERLDEKLKPINEGLKALLPKEEKEEEKEAGKAKKEEEEKEEETPEEKEEEETEEEEDEEKDALKAENLTLKETLDKLQKARKGLSKAEKGQEDEEPPKKYTVKDHLKGLDRDSMGRAIKKKE